MTTFDEAIRAGKTTKQNALSLFDQLETLEIDFMYGTWKGAGFPTGHVMDGLLEASGWYGKSCQDQEHVHPLLFYKANKNGTFVINPALLPLRLLRLPLPKNVLLRKSLLAAKAFLQTRKYKARLRMVVYRGKPSAAMIYDDKPIIDFFRKVDDRTVLGLMDMKGMDHPYFFVLKRITPIFE